MKTTLELLTGRILEAFHIDMLLAENLKDYHKSQVRETRELDQRILEIDSIFAGLFSANEQIRKKIDEVLQVKKDLIRQREEMEVAASKSQEDLWVAQDHADYVADTGTLAKAHKVLFTQDDQLFADIVAEIDGRHLEKGLERLDAVDLAHLKLAIMDVEAERGKDD